MIVRKHSDIIYLRFLQANHWLVTIKKRGLILGSSSCKNNTCSRIFLFCKNIWYNMVSDSVCYRSGCMQARSVFRRRHNKSHNWTIFTCW